MRLRTAALFGLMMVFIATTVSAQGITAKGLKLGVNMAKMSVDCEDCSTDNKVGLVAGGFVRAGINSMFSVQPEILFSMKGGKESDNGDDFKLKLNYLEIPILAHLAFAPAASVQPFIVVGPAIALRMGVSTDPDEGDVDDFFKKADVGLAVGGGIQANRISVEARFTQGLMDVITDEGHDSFSSEKVKNRVLSILLGVGF